MLVQVLPPGGAWLAGLVPYRGVYGPTILFSSITYSQALEISGGLSFLGLFLWAYARDESFHGRSRIVRSLGLPLLFFGALVAAAVYTEIHLSWGELWYGVKFADLDPRGFPWGSEQVAYNTCLVRGSFSQDPSDNCLFLNYDWLLYLSAISAAVGMYLRRWRPEARVRDPQ